VSTEKYHKLGRLVFVLCSTCRIRYRCRAARPGRRDADAAASAPPADDTLHERSVAAVNAQHTITATAKQRNHGATVVKRYTDAMTFFHFVYFVFKRRKTMAGCTLMAGVMLLYLTAVVHRNAASDVEGTAEQVSYFV